MQLKRIYDQTYNWLNERVGLDEVLQFLRHKEVPIFKASIWYYFGGLSLFLFRFRCSQGSCFSCTTVPEPTPHSKAFSL